MSFKSTSSGTQRGRSGSVLNKGKKKASYEEKAQEKLQAIVLADSFTREFRPITLEKPRSLLPLVNIPILEYVLELLASSGVEEIYVFCCYSAKVIQQYISKSKWAKPQLQDPIVKTIASESAYSTGDALRTIHSLDLIRHDFILISGDVISNLDLRPIISQHKNERKLKTMPPLLMTSVFKKQRPSKLNFYHDKDHVWMAIATDANQLLLFENEKQIGKNMKKFSVPVSKFKRFKNIQIRSDLIDCHIDICSPDVLDIFNENFDFQDFRTDFLKDILLNDEIVEYKVMPYVISNEYAARVSSLRSYETISKDIVRRWLYPVVPDSNFTGETNYKFFRPNNYFEDNVTLARSCVVGEDTVIGRGTTIGENTIISGSVIGKNVKIGNHVIMEDCYVWDNVVIEDNVKMTKSLICSGAKALKNSVLQKGCVVSYGVVIGEGYIVPSHSRLTTKKELDEDEEEDMDDNMSDDSQAETITTTTATTTTTTTTVQESALGPNGFGHISRYSTMENKFNLLGVTDDELKEELLAVEEESVRPESPVEREPQGFIYEARETVRRAMVENHAVDNAQLELNALKFAFDATFLDLGRAALSSMILYSDDGKREPAEMLKAFRNILTGNNGKTTTWSKLLKIYIYDKENQIELLEYLLEFCKTDGKNFSRYIVHLVKHLYDVDVCTEDAILAWEARVKATAAGREPADMELLKSCSKFLEWLKTAEEEEEDDDDEEDEEEEDDEDDE